MTASLLSKAGRRRYLLEANHWKTFHQANLLAALTPKPTKSIRLKAINPYTTDKNGVVDQTTEYFETVPGETLYRIFNKPGVRTFTATNGIHIERDLS